MIEVTVQVNGAPRTGSVEARKTLADFLRDDLDLTGTHIGCEHGVCGACTVIVDGRAVRSCLMLAVQAAGCEITTIEGLATAPPQPASPDRPPGDGLGTLQQAMWDSHSFQCGFCTPGFLMLTASILEKRNDVGDEELLDLLSSNLCRCTGYQNIVAAVKAAREEMRSWPQLELKLEG